jgi:lipoprotein-anchoring transpeptidase ErfK/SrfK
VNSSHYQDSRKGGLLAAIFGSKQRDRRARQAAVQPVTPARPVIPATQINHSVLASTNSSNSSVMIDVARQKVFLLKDGSQVALEAPISSARPGKTTPRGTFKITEKIRTGKISTIYDVHMPNWMRLSGSAYGVHAGYLPGYPASAGCVRLPSDAAAIIYDHVGYGTRVTITDGWVGDRVYVNLSQDTFRY